MLRTAALGSVLALALAAGASASLVAALDMRQLVERADRVAVVQVVAQATRQDDRSRIVTDVTLEVLEPLPTRELSPSEVAAIAADPAAADDKVVYTVTFTEEHLVRPAGEHAFVLQDYYDHPERYESDFEQYLPHLSLLLNCIYWTERYPRVVRKQDLPAMTRCKVIGNISCDVEGSIEATVKATEPGDPVYTYDAESDSAVMGVAGAGPVICAVDILPAELPRDASESFAAALGPFAKEIAAADYSGSLADSGLPDPIQRSCIVWRGELTPDYAYLAEHLPS